MTERREPERQNILLYMCSPAWFQVAEVSSRMRAYTQHSKQGNTQGHNTYRAAKCKWKVSKCEFNSGEQNESAKTCNKLGVFI